MVVVRRNVHNAEPNEKKTIDDLIDRFIEIKGDIFCKEVLSKAPFKYRHQKH